ncbi:MAG: TlpA family protein disulfide reductase, partial [Bdellovibrionota bacterium]
WCSSLRFPAFLFSVVLIFLFHTGCKSFRDSSLAPGRHAPQIALKTLDGVPVSLDDFKGKIVVLNFLASWCKPCEDEMSSLLALQSQLGNSLQVVAVGVEDDDDALREFRDRNNVTFPFFHDQSGNSKQRYRIAGYPETFVLDRDGKLLLVPDYESGGSFTLKFVGPRQWDSPQMLQFFSQL